MLSLLLLQSENNYLGIKPAVKILAEEMMHDQCI